MLQLIQVMGTPVAFTDTFNTTGFNYVSNALSSGDDVFFYFQGTPSTSNSGHYGVNQGATLVLNYTMPSEPQLVDGTVFEYTDTGKHYVWNSSTSTWTEVV